MDLLILFCMLPFKLFLAAPWLTLAVAGLFAVAATRRSRELGERIVLVAVALVWLAYGGWEWHMQSWRAATGEAPARMDLMLIAPLMLATTAFGIMVVVGNRYLSRHRIPHGD